MDRRSFVRNACLGSASLYFYGFAHGAQSDIPSPKAPHIETRGLSQPMPSPLGMPGLFPGRVVEVSSSEAIVRNRVSQPLIKEMLERGMKELTGENLT